MKLIDGADFEERTKEANINTFRQEIADLKPPEKTTAVSFIQWKKIENPIKLKSGKKANKVTRKVAITLPWKQFIERYLKEIDILKDHLHRVHMQYKKFKEAREEVAESDGDVAAMQIDWSENARIRQAKEAKGAYYYEDHVAIHCIRSMRSDGDNSYISISDSTCHNGEAVWASIRPMFVEYVEEGVTHIYVISDSPTSQYRNKKIFYLVKQFCDQNPGVKAMKMDLSGSWAWKGSPGWNRSSSQASN